MLISRDQGSAANSIGINSVALRSPSGALINPTGAKLSTLGTYSDNSVADPLACIKSSSGDASHRCDNGQDDKK